MNEQYKTWINSKEELFGDINVEIDNRMNMKDEKDVIIEDLKK